MMQLTAGTKSSAFIHSYDLSAHYETDLLQLHQLNSQRYPYLLESVAHSSANGHYDILFAFPQFSLVLDPLNGLHYTAHGPDAEPDIPQNACAQTFLDEFDYRFKQNRVDEGGKDLGVPFLGGWFVYLGYELAQQIEPVLQLPQPDREPVAYATRIPVAIVRDARLKRLLLVWESSFALCSQIRDQVLQDLTEATASLPGDSVCNNVEEEEPQRYISSVKAIKSYIKEGDVFQVNLSRRWNMEFNGDYTQLYRRLRRHNPASYFGLAKFQQHIIMSSSPERLVRVTGDVVETRPIAGTRPTAHIAADDSAYKSELMSHPKERAEHVMLIDLERNDLGRICRPGSIHVNELMVLESYAHVHHIVSNIKGRLLKGTTPGEVIKAVFPGGTITGCPKVRCMEIIAELEQQARGAYTGSIGYINHNGDMDFNILIRTMKLCDNHLSLRAGAGIVADSEPQWELEETRAKARGILLALGLLK
ncbi:MAG: aminodeoxychorismate synthase component I [Gammaproteobacteria bacterium]|nr:aminodeoxychorismate synthase component I [Gammaproteobacteria bacterium]MDH5799376.1 aminodeoxychorismate synthase component I [Gammaproteobacteria bacterium]